MAMLDKHLKCTIWSMKRKNMLKSPAPLFSLNSPLHSQRCCSLVALQPQFLTKSLNLIQKKCWEAPPLFSTQAAPSHHRGAARHCCWLSSQKKKLSSHYQWLSSQQHIKMPYNHHTTWANIKNEVRQLQQKKQNVQYGWKKCIKTLHKQSGMANDTEVAHYLERSMTSIF